MEQHGNFASFVDTIATLRGPHGCPWDQAQTHQSIAHNMIEEAFEAAEALESGRIPAIREELGDVLLQVVLQSQIAQDANEFTIDDVCGDIDAKIRRRHPHIFGEAAASDAADVQKLWDAVKLTEAEHQPAAASLMDSVPTHMPALMSAQKISRKAASVGFDWDCAQDVWDKVAEEISEFHEATTPQDKELEFGDILFALVNVARKEGIDAESALRASNAKFRARWLHMEQAAHQDDLHLADMSMDELETLWQQAKQDLNNAH